MNGFGGFARVVFCVALAAGIWALAHYDNNLPTVIPANASPTLFSAQRADAVLARLLGPERPHPASTPENAAVRQRILGEYAKLGVPTSSYRALGCRLNANFGFMACATVTDILAEVRPGSGKSIVLLSHYDSVPAGPGASDDEASVATTLETVRALKAAGDHSLHPILALHTDGEEFGLLGAESFLANSTLKARVGTVVNVEARGNRGPSLLFQTSPGDGPLIDLYARSVSHYATSSLFEVVYKALRNDTDLSVFLRDGFPSWNFAFSENVAHYHTPLDRRENLSWQTLQMHGENLLGMTRGLEATDFAKLKGPDSIYISILGRWLPRMPASWALPLSLLAFALVLFAAWSSREPDDSVRGWLAAFGIVPLLVLGAAALGWLLHTVAALVSAQPDPSYAHPVWLRIALGLGVLGATLLVARLADMRKAAFAVWLWMAWLAVMTAALLPGLSPYFLFPSLVAAVLLFGQTMFLGARKGAIAQAGYLLAAMPALLIWLSLVSAGETVMGLSLHPLFTVPAAFAAASLVPLIAGRSWTRCAATVLGTALIVAIVAGTRPTYSEMRPLRMNINYVEDASAHRAFWSADTYGAPLPGPMRAVAKFSAKREHAYPMAFFDTYVAPAGTPKLAPPTADVSEATSETGTRRISLALHRASDANQMVVIVPRDAGLKAVEIDDSRFAAPEPWSKRPQVVIGCFSNDCRDKTITLEVASHKPFDITVGEQSYGLPPEGNRLVAARPKTVVPSQLGDTTVRLNKVAVK